MKPAVKWGIAAASGAAVFLALRKMKKANEEQNANIANNLQLIASEAQTNIIRRKINKQVFSSDGKLKDTPLDAFMAEAGKTYLVCVSFFGSVSGVGMVGAACENWQVRFPQSKDKYDYGVNLTAVITTEETKAVGIRALYHGSITITTGDIVIIEL